ncbi:MAG: type I restriction endonuclease [Promethearchaeota archaeon]
MEFFQELKEKIRRLRNEDVNEANTRSNLIDLLLNYLGWDIHNFEEVEKERQVLSGTIVDYALKINNDIKIYIEAKRINNDLKNFKEISDAIRYANDDGIEWLIMTNGDKYNIYKVLEPGNLNDKLVLRIKISDENNLEFFDYFKKENVQNNILDTELNRYLITNKVIKSLNDIFANQNEEFLNLLKEIIRGLDQEQITEALTNIDYSFSNTLLPVNTIEEESIEQPPSKISNNENSIDIILPPAQKADNPYWRKYNLIPIFSDHRTFFPGYKVPFTLETDFGEITTWVTGGRRDDTVGDPRAGIFISTGITDLYRRFPDLKPGDTLRIIKLEENRYRLEVIKK